MDRADYQAWDAYVEAAADGSWFHTTAWMSAVEGAFGHQPVYLQATRGDRIVGVLPLFLIRSLLGGRMLVVKILKLGMPDSTSSGIWAMSVSEARCPKIGW